MIREHDIRPTHCLECGGIYQGVVYSIGRAQLKVGDVGEAICGKDHWWQVQIVGEREVEQLELFQAPRKVEYEGETIGERFEEFDRANPHVYREIVRRSIRLRRRGVGRIGIAAIFESMRYDHAIQTGGDEYKLNNSFRAFYSRKVMAENVELEGLFELREQVSK